MVITWGCKNDLALLRQLVASFADKEGSDIKAFLTINIPSATD
jgi:hypothetical protein